jgi:hypothetical protein
MCLASNRTSRLPNVLSENKKACVASMVLLSPPRDHSVKEGGGTMTIVVDVDVMIDAYPRRNKDCMQQHSVNGMTNHLDEIAPTQHDQGSMTTASNHQYPDSSSPHCNKTRFRQNTNEDYWKK